jgi:hypothetical protein
VRWGRKATGLMCTRNSGYREIVERIVNGSFEQTISFLFVLLVR